MSGYKIKFNGIDRLYDKYSWRLTKRAKLVWQSGQVLQGSYQAELEQTIAKHFAVAYTDTGTTAESHAIAFSQGTHTESLSASDQGNQPYVVDGYWNDSSDGTVADNYCLGDEQFDWTMTKGVADSATTSDSIATGAVFNRSFAETPTVSETFIVGQTREFAESISAAQTFAVLSSITKTETVTVSDANTLGINNAVSEGLNASEALDSINTSKGITDTGSITESVAQALSKPAVADTASATDVGIGSVQDYVDPTYLSEDYVGIGWNIT